jgi:hypothetical protein
MLPYVSAENGGATLGPYVAPVRVNDWAVGRHKSGMTPGSSPRLTALGAF